MFGPHARGRSAGGGRHNDISQKRSVIIKS
jgi:hypothetical protein